jgi:CFEM domain
LCKRKIYFFSLVFYPTKPVNLVRDNSLSTICLNGILRMKLHLSAFALVAGLSTLIKAGTEVDWPPCVVRNLRPVLEIHGKLISIKQPCINKAAKVSGCGRDEPACYCKSKSFLGSVKTCEEARCCPADIQSKSHVPVFDPIVAGSLFETFSHFAMFIKQPPLKKD